MAPEDIKICKRVTLSKCVKADILIITMLVLYYRREEIPLLQRILSLIKVLLRRGIMKLFQGIRIKFI